MTPREPLAGTPCVFAIAFDPKRDQEDKTREPTTRQVFPSLGISHKLGHRQGETSEPLLGGKFMASSVALLSGARIRPARGACRQSGQGRDMHLPNRDKSWG